MRKLVNILGISVICLHAPAQVMWQMNKDTVLTWYYKEGDEFNGKSLNTNYWEYSYGWARSIASQKEQQYYTDGENHELKDGQLILNAKRGAVTRRLVDWMGDNDTIFNNGKFAGLNKRVFNYTGGMIQTRKELQYGYFEIKFTMSPGQGYWPAFWMWGGTPNEEIDFCELKTEKKNKIHVGRHAPKESDNYVRYFLFKKKLWGDWVTFNGDLTKTYNVIAGEWNKDYVKYYLNGECIAYTKLSMPVPKRLTANIAVPSNNGPFKPAPPKDDPGLGEFKIDYIRVWSREPAAKGYDRQMPVVDSFAVQRALGRSALRSKGKFLYGKKTVHKNEGITVSLFPLAENKYALSVMGKSIPANSTYTLVDADGKKIRSKDLTYGEHILSMEEFTSSNVQLVLDVYGKKAGYTLLRH